MVREAVTTINAIQWYSRHGDGQFANAEELDRYDHAARTLTRRADFASVLVKHIVNTPPGSTLEIAAGTGIVSEVIQEHIPETIYTDIEPAAIDALRRRLGTAAIERADFLNLPFGDQSYDTVIGVGAYRYVPSERKQEFWDEMHRVLRPHGRAFIAQFYPRGFPLRGSDINDGMYHCQRLFSMQNVWSYDAKIDIGPLCVKTGSYRSYEFRRRA